LILSALIYTSAGARGAILAELCLLKMFPRDDWIDLEKLENAEVSDFFLFSSCFVE